MADARSVVELVFQGVDKTGEATQAALNNAQKFSASVQKIAAPLADATEKAIKLEAAIIATGVTITAFAVKTAGDFDAAFREISTLIDEPIEDLDAFRRAILDYAQESSQGLDDITDAVYSAISAGIDYTNSLEVVAKAEQLAIAGKSSLKEALIALEGPLNAYGAASEDAGDFADALFQAVRDGITTLPELSNSLSRVTGLAANAGIEFGELLAAVSALTATGTPTAEAVTQIRAAISNIISPSQQAATFAEDLGLEFNAAALETRGFAGVLQDAAEATDGQIDELSKLFGSVQALGGVLTLTGVAAESFEEALEGQAQRAGVTATAYEKMADDISLANQRVANALRVLFTEIGDPLLDQYGSLANAIAGIFNALADSVTDDEGLGSLVQFVESVMEDLVGVFEDVARNLPAALSDADLSGFQRNIEGVIDGVRRLLSGVDVTTEDGLRTLIEGVGEGLARLGAFVGDAIAVFGPLLDAALKIAEAVVTLDERWFEWGGKIGGVSIILDRLLPQLDTLLLLLIAAKGTGIAGGAGKAAAGVGALAGSVKLLAGALAGGVGYLIGSQLVDPIDRAIDRLTGSDSLGGLLFDFIDGLEDRTAADGILGIGNTIAQWILSWGNASDELADATKKTDTKLAELGTRWGEVDESSKKASESLKEASGTINEMPPWLDAANEALERFRDEQRIVVDEAGRWRELKGPIAEVAPVIENAEAAARGYKVELIDGIPTFTQYGTAAAGAFEEASDAADDAIRKSEDYLLKMEEIASNERIKNIEAKISLDIAEVEANAQIAEAAFDSINATIQSTGELIGSLFGNFERGMSEFDRQEMLRQIDKENERRDEALKLQKELTEAQIREIDARIRNMERGDAMIQIDGAGLQPHLEAFMWEILRSIQTRVNQDGLEMLLGTPA